ncbi:MAG: hypothetical protein HY700_07220 [Gemmatimonadetes bacterium]|nr:hypothetical protein [Gemmatimonadota bacterium]
MRFATTSLLGAALLASASAHAQSASYNTPIRAFEKLEVGALVGFRDGGTAYEGVYRAANGRIDVGIRGGTFEPAGFRSSSILAGVEVRAQVIRHDPVFPLDGALIVGTGGSFLHRASRFTVPLGLSLGRRFGFTSSSTSIAPYVQPTVLLHGGHELDTRMILGVGFGTDFRLSNALDIRLGVSVGDLQGASLGAVWVH